MLTHDSYELEASFGIPSFDDLQMQEHQGSSSIHTGPVLSDNNNTDQLQNQQPGYMHESTVDSDNVSICSSVAPIFDITGMDQNTDPVLLSERLGCSPPDEVSSQQKLVLKPFIVMHTGLYYVMTNNL